MRSVPAIFAPAPVDHAELPAIGSTGSGCSAVKKPRPKVTLVSGELIQPGGSDEERPELRASHADRDRVVELLRVAAGDGRLTAEELDQRLEAALTARTQRELAVLTADLPAEPPAPGAAPARDVITMVHRGGNAAQVGPWTVPRRMDIQVTGGNVRLDFTDAVITSPVLRIDLRLRGGNLLIVTRPGVVVDTSDIEMTGGNVHVRPPRLPHPPTVLRVEVAGQVHGGNVRARGRRRSFWQWLLRRTGPDARPAIRS